VVLTSLSPAHAVRAVLPVRHAGAAAVVAVEVARSVAPGCSSGGWGYGIAETCPP
jgi:hypothetical protein